jgi:hypothetical protein
VLTTGETSFLDAVAGSDCSAVSWAEVGPSSSQGFSVPPLAGRMLYQARLLGAWSPQDGIGPDGTVDPGPLRTAELREVFRWEFITSRYAGFTEHMASYDPDVSLWDGAQAIRPGDVDLAAVVAEVLAVQDSDPAWDEPEKAATEALFDLLGVPRASAPEGVEVTVIRDGDGGALALLLDSPEPLDWDRITATVARGGGHPIDHVLARARDGRRALVTRRTDGTSLPAFATRQLTLSLDYDLSVPPTLYRDGASGIETASLLVPLPGS